MQDYSDSTLESGVTSGISVIDFYADWCNPCKALKKTLEKLSTEMPEVSFGKVNIEDNIGSTDKYKIASVPTVIIFKDGEAKDKITGLVSEAKLKEAIKRNT